MSKLPDRGSRFRSAREQAGLSRETLAASAAVSVSTLVRLENYDQLPNAAALARIAGLIGLSLDEALAEQRASA